MTALSADVAFGREDEVVHLRADELGEDATGLVHRPVEAPSEELGRPALELELPPLVVREHPDRTRAVAPVVEVGDVRIEEETLAHRWLVSHGPRTPSRFRILALQA